jgi:hypothetical protein
MYIGIDSKKRLCFILCYENALESTKVLTNFQVPFPSVTVCPQTKFKQSDFNYTDVLLKNSEFLEEFHSDKGDE